MSRSPGPRLALAALLLATALAACSKDDPPTTVTFGHGVASGDPLADRVILWTHVAPSRQEPVTLEWQVATSAAFTTLAASGAATTSAAADYTAKVDVTGLAAGTTYWYRFRHGDQVSPVGRTKTCLLYTSPSPRD